MKKLSVKTGLALLLAALMATQTLAGCSNKKIDEDIEDAEVEVIDKGAEINAYIATYPYDLDPGRIQYDSELSKYYSLIYEGLFKISESGKLEGALAKEWEYEEDERDGKLKLQIKLASTSWSDGVAVDADDVVYSFKRLLAPENSNPAAAVLYPIENAKAAKSGLVTIDDVGFSAINASTVEIIFEKEFTDVEYFLRNLASPVFTPLREDVISTYGDDWAQAFHLKKQRDGDDTVNSIVTNGPFLVKEWTNEFLMLERSSYYRNLNPEQKVTQYVTPYRFIINFANEPDVQIENYNLKEGIERVFLIGSFSKEGYEQYASKADSFAAGSAYTYYFNTENKLFANEKVRKALSIALDRNEIASIVGRGAVPATGYVPTGVIADDKGKKEYRDAAEDVISASAKLDEAKALLKEAGVTKGNFTITVRKDNDWEIAVAEYAQSVWKNLGFNAKIEKLTAKSDKQHEVSEFETKLASGDFEVIGFDNCAMSADAYSFLVPFAREFSGSVVPVDDDAEPSSPHITGFDDEEYNALIKGVVELDEEGEVASATGILGAKNAAERLAIYKQAEAMLAEKVPSAPLFFGTNSYIVSGKLSKVEYNSNGNPVLNKTKLSSYKKYKLSEVTAEEK
ncbi:MAG: peptide ABC transporter substrate-binding protein [Clostridia bacterium]|nr:peptide ABC transporter substrate-binding protein [Clostridia bacterium]